MALIGFPDAVSLHQNFEDSVESLPHIVRKEYLFKIQGVLDKYCVESDKQKQLRETLEACQNILEENGGVADHLSHLWGLAVEEQPALQDEFTELSNSISLLMKTIETTLDE